MLITLFDYGAGNLHSLAKALEMPGATVRVEPDPVRALDTDLLVLPGVGAFAAAAARLAPGRDAMRAALQDGLPCVGICLGMQLLLDGSDEGEGVGLGVVPGRVERLRARRVPQIGWNAIEDVRDPLFARAPLGVAYYANSYVCRPASDGAVIAWSTHEGDRFAAAVRVGNTVGVQFHPEKSSAAGVAFLRAVVGTASDARRGASDEGRRGGRRLPARGAPPEPHDAAVAPVGQHRSDADHIETSHEERP
ncbi:MAG TPA: imidazole glycerol phosphate synthase subunit HisH [Gemmatimonadaceae bacterium]|nr:imidazole glycerol phosphate synthase subunit HisH [Gemmatimonadaceae bacterium]